MLDLFRNRHREYQELLNEHLDARLDAAGEERLRHHLEGCESCATELRELQAVRLLVRSEPMVDAPRSFALPYAPRQAPANADRAGIAGWVGGGTAAALRSMQVATATAALVLIALIGFNVADTGGTVLVESAALSPAGDAFVAPDVAPESAGAAARAADGAERPDSGGAEAPPSLSAAAPLAPDTEGPPVDDPSTDRELTARATEPPLALGAEAEAAAPVAPLAIDTGGRGALDWALVGLGGLTAALALGVVALTWSARRSSI